MNGMIQTLKEFCRRNNTVTENVALREWMVESPRNVRILSRGLGLART